MANVLIQLFNKPLLDANTKQLASQCRPRQAMVTALKEQGFQGKERVPSDRKLFMPDKKDRKLL